MFFFSFRAPLWPQEKQGPGFEFFEPEGKFQTESEWFSLFFFMRSSEHELFRSLGPMGICGRFGYFHYFCSGMRESGGGSDLNRK